MIDRNNVVDVLEDLIEVCRDGQNGYRDAAEHVKDESLRSFFNEQSLERATFAGELEVIAQRIGERDPTRSGSFSGAMHRAWFDLKEKMGMGDQGILNSVEAGEDRAKHAYKDAIRAELPADIREIVERQNERVIAAHDRARMLRDTFQQKAA